MKIFSTETKIYQRLTEYSAILLTGIMWLLLFLPVVTAGASCTAMSRMMLNIREDKSAGVALFFKTFAKEFKRSTVIWLIMLIVPAAVLALYLFTDITSSAAVAVIFVFVALWIISLMYVFPLNAYFENTVSGTLKNSLLMALSHIKSTLPLLLITLLPLFVYAVIGNRLFIYTVPVWIFVLLPFMEYWKSYFLLRVFYDYVPEEQQTAFRISQED